MKGDIFETAAMYAAQLARATRQPKRTKLTRRVGWNQEQECARRHGFYERHRHVMGGGPRWEDDPRNPHVAISSRVGTVITHG